jgi:hypothetical protein
MRTQALTVGAIVALGAAAGAAQAAPMSIVYDREAAARILSGPGSLGPQHGLYRQDPGRGGVFADGYDHHRLAKVSGHDLSTMTVAEMVATLKTAVDGGPGVLGGASHIAMVDEIGNAFRDPRTRRCYRKVTIRGTRTVRIACQNRIRLTRSGWRLVKRKAPPPRIPGAKHPGMRLTSAMRQLDAMPFGGAGQTYADRVHFYIAPALVTLLGDGRGVHFTRTRNGLNHNRPGIRGVAGALARSGGNWLEMYHGDGTAVRKRVWLRVAKRFDGYMRRHGGTANRTRFMMSGTSTRPRGVTTCATPMACNWKLAKRGYNLRVLSRGVGVYNANSQAAQWRQMFKAHFGIS